VRSLATGMIAQAERNKVFREGWFGSLRYVALDGWEPFSSYRRRCPECLIRHVKFKDRRGNEFEREQYYHRYVVAMLIDERLDLVLDIEPLLPADLRPGPIHDKHEGELTAAMRLLPRVKQTFGWVDVAVGDSLYANGPFLSLVQRLKMSAIVVARKKGDEPLREAIALTAGRAPNHVETDHQAHERVELWDCPGVETLSTYKGPIRVVRARVTRTEDPAKPAPTKARKDRCNQGTNAPESMTWGVAATGLAAIKLSAFKILTVARKRWHLENTGFHQWVSRWKFSHVFVHKGRAILALFWFFFAAYNLLTLFLYRQLRCYGRDRGKDVTRTISRLVDELKDDLVVIDLALLDPG
jgi:hypothetical protein